MEDIYLYAEKMARKDRKMVIYEWQILGITLYLCEAGVPEGPKILGGKK